MELMGHYSMGGWRGKFSKKVNVKDLVDQNNLEKKPLEIMVCWLI